MPQEMVGDLFREFDAEQKQVFEKLVGTSLNGDQWKLAQQPIRFGGCGIRGAEEGADAAYVMSRAMSREACMDLDRQFVGEGEIQGDIYIYIYMQAYKEPWKELTLSCPRINK